MTKRTPKAKKSKLQHSHDEVNRDGRRTLWEEALIVIGKRRADGWVLMPCTFWDDDAEAGTLFWERGA